MPRATRSTRSTRKTAGDVPQELPVSSGRDRWPKGYKKKNLAIVPDLEADVDMTSDEKEATLILPPTDEFTEEHLEKIKANLKHMGIEEILHWLTLFQYDTEKTFEHLKERRIMDPLTPFVKRFFFHNVWRIRNYGKEIRDREKKLWETKGIWHPKSPAKYFYCARKLNGLATPQELAELYYDGKHWKGVRKPFLDPRMDLDKLNELVDVMVKLGMTIEDGSVERRKARRLEKKKMLSLKDQPRDENGMIVKKDEGGEDKENQGRKEKKDKRKEKKVEKKKEDDKKSDKKSRKDKKKPEDPETSEKKDGKDPKKESTKKNPEKKGKKEVVEEQKKLGGSEGQAVKNQKEPEPKNDKDPKKESTKKKPEKKGKKGKKEGVEDQKKPKDPEDPEKKYPEAAEKKDENPAQAPEGDEPMDVDRKTRKRKRDDPEEEEKKPEEDNKEKPPPLRSMQWQRAERLRIQMEEQEKKRLAEEKRNKGKKGKKAPVKEPEPALEQAPEKPKKKKKKRRKPAIYPVMTGPWPKQPTPKTPWFLNQRVIVHRKADGTYYVTPYREKRLRREKMTPSVKSKVVRPQVKDGDSKPTTSGEKPEIIIVKDSNSPTSSGDPVQTTTPSEAPTSSKPILRTSTQHVKKDSGARKQVRFADSVKDKPTSSIRRKKRPAQPTATIKRTIKISIGVNKKPVTPTLGKQLLKFLLAKLKQKSGSLIPKASVRGIQKTRVTQKPIPVITITDDKEKDSEVPMDCGEQPREVAKDSEMSKEKPLSSAAPTATANDQNVPIKTEVPASGEQQAEVIATDDKVALNEFEAPATSSASGAQAVTDSEALKKSAPLTSARWRPTVIAINGNIVVDDRKRLKQKPKPKVPKLSEMCKQVLNASGIPLPPDSVVPDKKNSTPNPEDPEVILVKEVRRKQAVIRIRVKKKYTFKKSCFNTMSVGKYIRETKPRMWEMWNEQKREVALKMPMTKLEMMLSGKSIPNIKVGQKVRLSEMPPTPPQSPPPPPPPPEALKQVKPVVPVAKPAVKPAPKPAPKPVPKPAPNPSETSINSRPRFIIHPGYPVDPSFPPIVLPPIVPFDQIKPIGPTEPNTEPIVIDTDGEDDNEPVFLGIKKFRPPIKTGTSKDPIVLNEDDSETSDVKNPDKRERYLRRRVRNDQPVPEPSNPNKKRVLRRFHCSRFMAQRINADPRYKIISTKPLPGLGTIRLKVDDQEPDVKVMVKNLVELMPKGTVTKKAIKPAATDAKSSVATKKDQKPVTDGATKKAVAPSASQPKNDDDDLVFLGTKTFQPMVKKPDGTIGPRSPSPSRTKLVKPTTSTSAAPRLIKYRNIRTGEVFTKMPPNAVLVVDGTVVAAPTQTPVNDDDDDLVFLGTQKFQPMVKKPDGTIGPRSPSPTKLVKPTTTPSTSAAKSTASVVKPTPTLSAEPIVIDDAEEVVPTAEGSKSRSSASEPSDTKTSASDVKMSKKMTPNAVLTIKDNKSAAPDTIPKSIGATKKTDKPEPIVIDKQVALKAKPVGNDDDDDLICIGTKKFQPMVKKPDGSIGPKSPSPSPTKLVKPMTSKSAAPTAARGDAKSSAFDVKVVSKPAKQIPKRVKQYRNLKTGEIVSELPPKAILRVNDPAGSDVKPKSTEVTKKDEKLVKAETTMKASKADPKDAASNPSAAKDAKLIRSTSTAKKTSTTEPPKRPVLSGTMANVQKYVDRRLAKAYENRKPTLSTAGNPIVKVVRLTMDTESMETMEERLSKVLKIKGFKKMMKKWREGDAPEQKPCEEKTGEVVTNGDDLTPAEPSVASTPSSEVPPTSQPIANDEPMQSSGPAEETPPTSQDQPEAVNPLVTPEKALPTPAEPIVTDEPMETDAPVEQEDAKASVVSSEGQAALPTESSVAPIETDKKSETPEEKKKAAVELTGDDRVMVLQLYQQVLRHKKELRKRKELSVRSDKIARRPAGISKPVIRPEAKPSPSSSQSATTENLPTEPSAESLKPEISTSITEIVPPTTESSSLPTTEPVPSNQLPTPPPAEPMNVDPSVVPVEPSAEPTTDEPNAPEPVQKVDEPSKKSEPSSKQSDGSSKKHKKRCKKCGKRSCYLKKKWKAAKKEEKEMKEKKEKKRKRRPLPPGIHALTFRSLDGLEIPGVEPKTVKNTSEDSKLWLCAKKPVNDGSTSPIKPTDPVPSTDFPKQPATSEDPLPTEAASVSVEPSDQPPAQPLEPTVEPVAAEEPPTSVTPPPAETSAAVPEVEASKPAHTNLTSHAVPAAEPTVEQSNPEPLTVEPIPSETSSSTVTPSNPEPPQVATSSSGTSATTTGLIWKDGPNERLLEMAKKKKKKGRLERLRRMLKG